VYYIFRPIVNKSRNPLPFFQCFKSFNPYINSNEKNFTAKFNSMNTQINISSGNLLWFFFFLFLHFLPIYINFMRNTIGMYNIFHQNFRVDPKKKMYYIFPYFPIFLLNILQNNIDFPIRQFDGNHNIILVFSK
jgi:hypothetical protein